MACIRLSNWLIPPISCKRAGMWGGTGQDGLINASCQWDDSFPCHQRIIYPCLPSPSLPIETAKRINSTILPSHLLFSSLANRTFKRRCGNALGIAPGKTIHFSFLASRGWFHNIGQWITNTLPPYGIEGPKSVAPWEMRTRLKPKVNSVTSWKKRPWTS